MFPEFAPRSGVTFVDFSSLVWLSRTGLRRLRELFGGSEDCTIEKSEMEVMDCSFDISEPSETSSSMVPRLPANSLARTR